MKHTKDVVCDPRTNEEIQDLIKVAKHTGSNMVGVEVPWGDPESCDKNEQDTLEYMIKWIELAHTNGYPVWLRPTMIGFEDIYDVEVDPNKNYLEEVRSFTRTIAPYLQEGDVFTPFPESQLRICGMYGAQDSCIFESAEEYNQWVRDLADIVESTLAEEGLEEEVTFLCCGFDAFLFLETIIQIILEDLFWREKQLKD